MVHMTKDPLRQNTFPPSFPFFQLSETPQGTSAIQARVIESEPEFAKMIPISDKLLCCDCFRQDNGTIKVTFEPCDKGATCHELESQTFES